MNKLIEQMDHEIQEQLRLGQKVQELMERMDKIDREAKEETPPKIYQ